MQPIDFEETEKNYDTILSRAFTKMYQEGLDEWSNDFSLDRASQLALSVTNRQLNQCKKPYQKRRVLDIGCGTGRHAEMFILEGFSYLGIDICSSKFWDHLQNIPDISFYQTQFPTELNLGLFDIVLDNGCFHHQSADSTSRYLDAISRVLQPNGFLSIVVWAEPFSINGTDSYGRFHHFYSKEELACLLKNYGFSPFSLQNITARNGLVQLHGIFTRVT